MKRTLTAILVVLLVGLFPNTVFADEEAYNKSLAKTDAMIDYLNEVYLGKYQELAFDIDYCSDDDLELLQAVADYITSGCTNNLDKAEAIYDWMINNISYGDAAFSPIDVYKAREGLCSGQAQLMSTLFRLSGVPSAILRASKQGTKEIESLEWSNYYIDKKCHEFVMAYVDGGWYGYDSCWKWHKMSREKIADQYVVLHVDGILTYSEEAWDFSTWKLTDTWYIDGEYLSMRRGNVVESGGSGMQVGGCLNYYRQHYNRGSATYYIYQGEGTNQIGHAFLGGYYLTKYDNTRDVLLIDSNGVLEISYFDFNGNTYFQGVKVNDCIPDLGLTNNKINLYVGETIDFSSLYEGYTLSSDSLSIDGLTATATTEGETTLNLSNGTKNYTLNFYVGDFCLDELSQELCDHDVVEEDYCKYCGKHIETEEIVEIEEEEITEEIVVEEETIEEVVEEIITEDTQELVEEEIEQVEEPQEQVEEEILVQQVEEVVEEQVEETIQEEPQEEIVEEVVEQVETVEETIEEQPVVETLVEEKVEEELLTVELITEELVTPEEQVEESNATPLKPVVSFNPSNEIVIEPVYEETYSEPLVEGVVIEEVQEVVEETLVDCEEEIVYNNVQETIEENKVDNTNDILEIVFTNIKLLLVAVFENIRKFFRG